MLKALVKKQIEIMFFSPKNKGYQMLRKIGITTLVFYFCLLTSCPTIAQATETKEQKSVQALSWQDREKLLSRIQSWQISGKIAVQTNTDSGSANVDWWQRGSRYSISLYGPFGSNSLRLSGQAGHVSMIDSQGRRFTATSPEQLLGKVWGYHVPISNLDYWVRGLPVPEIPSHKRLDAYNRLITLYQSGWYVQFSNYTRVGKVYLPNKIFITSAQLKTKLMIYQWHAR